MKTKNQIENQISKKRFEKKLKRKLKKKKLLREKYFKYLEFKKTLNDDVSYANLLEKFLPTNLKFILSCEKSNFYLTKLNKVYTNNRGIFKVPKDFSIIDFPNESYKFIQELTAALILQKYDAVVLDYKDCKRLDLGAQVFLDIILRDILTFFKICEKYPNTRVRVKSISGKNINNEDIKKLLFSVGSPAIHSNRTLHFNDIEPYKLCLHNRDKDGDRLRIMEQKDIDTTTLVDYVLKSLKRLNKTLTPEKLDDLCTVIGEILINAEEHSTTKYRFSIGYFHEINENNNHYGVFRLVIMNFGNTIYEKFKDKDCPNINVVKKMKDLSESYNKRNFFLKKEFEEETLWTLYALQEGVTSIAPVIYKRRGNGSIQFIESFFNIKGRQNNADDISIMTILSGNTNITFDGTYNITEHKIEEENFKYMTFNQSGKIEDKPDKKFVKFVDNYFPGTIISAKILFNEDDIKENIKKDEK